MTKIVTTVAIDIDVVKNKQGEYIATVSGDDVDNGPITVKAQSVDPLINAIKASVQKQPDDVWDGIKDAISKL